MKAVDFYFWMVPQQPPKKPYQTTWRMTMEEGLKRFPAGKPVLSSKETRQLPDTPEERGFLGHQVKSYAPLIPMHTSAPPKPD